MYGLKIQTQYRWFTIWRKARQQQIWQVALLLGKCVWGRKSSFVGQHKLDRTIKKKQWKKRNCSAQYLNLHGEDLRGGELCHTCVWWIAPKTSLHVDNSAESQIICIISSFCRWYLLCSRGQQGADLTTTYMLWLFWVYSLTVKGVFPKSFKYSTNISHPEHNLSFLA